MAEKQDIAMNEFPINNVADYLYTEKGNNQQKVTPTDLVKSCGFFRFNKVFAPGEQYELPYSSGLIMIQNSTQTHDKAVATLCGGGSGTVIVPSVSLISSLKFQVKSAYLILEQIRSMLLKTKMNHLLTLS